MTNIDQQEDENESARVAEIAKQLGEQFDAVVILCTRHEGKGTRTVAKGCGNWHAQYGVVQEWLITTEAEIQCEAQSEMEKREDES